MDGRSYVGKVKLVDPVLFASDSVELVVEMFMEAFAWDASLEKPEPLSSNKDMPQSSRAEQSETRPAGSVEGPS